MQTNKKIPNHIKVFGIITALFHVLLFAVIPFVLFDIISAPFFAFFIYYYASLLFSNTSSLIDALKLLLDLAIHLRALIAYIIFFAGPFILFVIPIFIIPTTLIITILIITIISIQSVLILACFVFILLTTIMAFLNKQTLLKRLSIVSLILSIIRFIMCPIGLLSLLTFIFALVTIIGVLSQGKRLKKGA